MRCLVASVVAAVCLPACMGSMPSAHQDNAALRDELTALEKQSWVAWQKRDGAFFASFLAEDHVEVGFQGPAGKAAIVAFVGSPACVVENYDVDHFSATRISRDTALLVYHARQKTTCGGAAVPSPAWASSLYVHRDGRWQNAAYQQSPTTQ
jgi:uncharacterized protein (TIGR02246 family)